MSLSTTNVIKRCEAIFGLTPKDEQLQVLEYIKDGQDCITLPLRTSANRDDIGIIKNMVAERRIRDIHVYGLHHLLRIMSKANASSIVSPGSCLC
jgi:hypothetical protein